jgi:hypothetical protein
MRYVDRGVAHYWDDRGTDWKAVALRNLAEHTNQNPGTHEYQRVDGTRYAIAMMHEDGIGPSRLLLRDHLSQIFPKGYRVALPEMSCGLAFARDLERSEEAKLQDTIDRCYGKGSRPLAHKIYDPEDLLPASDEAGPEFSVVRGG